MNALEQFDGTFGVPTITRASTVFNGFYTMTYPDGSHWTLRIHTKGQNAKFAAGRRIVSLLIGPDNETDYKAFGFVDDSGIKVWKNFMGWAAFADTLWRLACGEEVPGYSLKLSKRCLVCNHMLTTPESIERGIGPNCWGKM